MSGLASADSQRTLRISTFNSETPRLLVSELVMAEIYGQLFQPWRLLRIPTEDALAGADAGLVDGELARVKALEKQFSRLKRIPYSIGTMKVVAYSRPEGPITSNLAELAGKKVAIMEGVAFTDNLTKSNERIFASTVEGMFNLLQSKQVDVVVVGQLDGEFFLRTKGFDSDDVVRSKPLLQVDLFHYIHKRNKDLIKRLRKHMAFLRKTGELARIIKRAEEEVLKR